MSTEDFNNGLIMGLSLQGTMFVDRGSHSTGGVEILVAEISIPPLLAIFVDIIFGEVIEL